MEKKEKPDRVIISISFNPQLPCISSIILKHWRIMVQDPWMKEVFQNPPVVTYRRPSNLRDKLTRNRIPDPHRMRPKRLISGMKPCGLNCPTCRYVEPGTVIQSSNTSKKIKINGTFNCKTRNEVYCITWGQCKLQYIGQTTRSLSLRLGGLLGNQP